MENSDYIEIIVAILNLQNTVTFTHHNDILTKGGGDAGGCILNKILYKASDILPIYVSQAAVEQFKKLNIINYKELIIHEVFHRSMKNINAHQYTYTLFRNPKTKIFHLDHNAPMAYICKKLAKINYKKGEDYIRKKVIDLLEKEGGIDCITIDENKARNCGTDANNKSRREKIVMSKSKMIKLQ